MAAPKEPYLKLWLRYKKDFQRNERGTAILVEEYRSEAVREKKLHKLIRKLDLEADQRRIWQARIYDHPGNVLIKLYREEFES